MSDLSINAIGNYNQLLGNALPSVQNVNAMADFEEVLQKQNDLISQNFDSTHTLQGGVNFDENLFEVQGIKEATSSEKTLNHLGKALYDGLASVNNQQVKSENLTMAFAAGEDVSMHEVMIESQKASLSLGMAVQMRNRLLNAYNEIKNMGF